MLALCGSHVVECCFKVTVAVLLCQLKSILQLWAAVDHLLKLGIWIFRVQDLLNDGVYIRHRILLRISELLFTWIYLLRELKLVHGLLGLWLQRGLPVRRPECIP